MICVSLGPESGADLPDIAKKYNFVEFRVDLLKDRIDDIIHSIKDGQKAIITYSGKDADKIKYQVLERILSFSPEFIDININFEYSDEIFSLAKKYSTKIILSYHNFNEAPADELLSKTVKEMMAKKPDLIKICCKMNSIKDIYRFSDFYGSRIEILG